MGSNPIQPESLSCLKHLTHLSYLDLSNCNLTRFPRDIIELMELRYLDVGMNELTELHPDLFHHLNYLQFFDASYNRLTTIPTRSLGTCRQLKELKLTSNKIQVLADEVARLRWLTTLAIDDNPLTDLPKHFAHLADIALVIVDDIWAPRIRETLNNVAYMKPSVRFDIAHTETFGARDDMEDGVVIQGALGGRKVILKLLLPLHV